MGRGGGLLATYNHPNATGVPTRSEPDAIRIGDLSDPSLIARRIRTTRRVTVAFSAYLARRGTPAVPVELARHDCIVHTRLATGN